MSKYAVLARVKSKNPTREEAWAKGDVFNLGVAADKFEAAAMKRASIRTVNMLGRDEEIDVWEEPLVVATMNQKLT